MATTYNLKPLRLRSDQDSFLSYIVRDIPEGASQTFAAGAPVVLTAGYVVEAADPVTAVFGIAVRGGRNGSAGVYRAEVAVVTDGVTFYANIGQSDPEGTPRAYAATDLGTDTEIAKITLASGDVIWHADIVTDVADSAKVISDRGDQVAPNIMEGEIAKVGDFNPRVEMTFLSSVRSFS